MPPARLLTLTATSVPSSLDGIRPLHGHARSLRPTTIPSTVRGVTRKSARGQAVQTPSVPYTVQHITGRAQENSVSGGRGESPPP